MLGQGATASLSLEGGHLAWNCGAAFCTHLLSCVPMRLREKPPFAHQFIHRLVPFAYRVHS